MTVCDKCKGYMIPDEVKDKFVITKDNYKQTYFDLCPICRKELFDAIERWIRNDLDKL